MTELGRTLHGLMLERGIEHPRDLARLLTEAGHGVSPQTVSEYMEGSREASPAFIRALAETLGLGEEERRRLASARERAEPGAGANERLEELLSAVASGTLSPSAAADRLKSGEVRYLDKFAVLDLGRASRKGVPEVVYAPGKSPGQVAAICEALLSSRERVVISGPTPEHEAELRRALPGVPLATVGRAVVAGSGEPAPSGGRVGAISAGTSDLPVLKEAVAVAREMGAAVESFHDVGVAGIHRLAGPIEELKRFDPDCMIVAAGMEGALPSVVSGLVDIPVIGLPTSTGYGLGGDGTAAILGMLQTCSPGLSVVNVDNGVGAGAMAALIANRAARRSRER
jgi:NCAIR mutase (PurE)-related protein